VSKNSSEATAAETGKATAVFHSKIPKTIEKTATAPAYLERQFAHLERVMEEKI
jgi:hypothetical protein